MATRIMETIDYDITKYNTLAVDYFNAGGFTKLAMWLKSLQDNANRLFRKIIDITIIRQKRTKAKHQSYLFILFSNVCKSQVSVKNN